PSARPRVRPRHRRRDRGESEPSRPRGPSRPSRLGRVGATAGLRLARAPRRRGGAAAGVQPRNRLPRSRARGAARRGGRRPDRVRVIGVLVSGEGSNLQALIDEGLEIAAVASNKPGVRALERASGAGIATAVFPLDEYRDRPARDSAMAAWLAKRQVDLVVLAGYMHLLTRPF